MKAEDFKEIIYVRDDQGIATLTFNIPARKNALSMYTFHEICAAIDIFESDNNAHALILTGAVVEGEDPQKESYSSGGYFSPDAYVGVPAEIMAQIDQSDIAQKKVTMKMFRCEKPILAAINGLAIGGAFTLTFAGCDQIYMSEHAWLQLPFAKLGISAELGSSFLLPRLMGIHKAKQVLFFGERISSDQAKELDLVNEVVPHQELMSYVYEKALQLSPPKAPALSIIEMKKLIRDSMEQDVSEALDRENVALRLLSQSEDFKEGLKARVEKREAVFKGR